jgi:hypothetical protein
LRWRALAPITKCAPCKASFKELQTSALDNTSSAPGNPDYFSLNVASAIQVFAYQNYVYNTTTQFEQSSNEIASFDELGINHNHTHPIKGMGIIRFFIHFCLLSCILRLILPLKPPEKRVTSF